MNTQAKPEKTLSRAERQRLLLRQEIIDTAFIEFSERGYHQTAVSHIAKRLGIGHGSFYRHFENKRDILEHVIMSVCDKIKSVLAEDNAPSASNSLQEYELQIQRIGASLTKIIIDTPGLFRMLFIEATSIDTEMTQSVTEFLDWCAEQTQAYFAHGVKLGYLRKDLDIAATAKVLVGMIMSTALMSINTTDQDMPKRINDAVHRMLLDGIATR